MKIYSNLLHFDGIKPLIIPLESKHMIGEETRITLAMAGFEMLIGDSLVGLTIDVASSRDAEISFKEEQTLQMLSYTPKTSGMDTLSFVFKYHNPKSASSIHIPIKYPIYVE